ncbi:MAG: leucine-rich repeat protein [Alistipes sp.]|nr:leucine-rich repeat protein [Alistipes sp.]
MKKLFLVLAAAFAMVACQTDINEVGVVADGVATVEFEVGAPQMRSYSDGMTATKLQYAVYEVKVEGENKTLSYLENLTAAGDEAKTLVNGAANVKIELANNKKYAAIFWASAAVDAPYTFNPAAMTVTVNYNGAVCNDESRDAFYAYKEFEVKGAATLGVELRRPFAQVNVGTSDLAEAAKSNFVPETSALVVKNVFSTLNLVDGTATDNVTEVTFAAATVPSGEEFKVAGHDYLAMSYVLVGKDKGSYDVTYTITAGDGTVINNTIGAVPMRANYRTNIYGKLLTSTTDINVEIKPGYSDDNKYEVVDGKIHITVDNADEFNGAFDDAKVDVIILGEDINLNEATTRAVENPTYTVASGKDITLDLGGHTLSAKSTQTGKNYEMLLVKGNLTVKNGTIETEHTGDNMEWNSMTTIFNITAGGVLNLEGVTAKNLGGSDMAFVAHLNNWGEVTLNVDNESTLESPYVAVRVFNSGPQMNNVTIKNSTLKGGNYALWVHNYTAADFGSETKAESQKALLNFNFEGADFVPNVNGVRYGFTNSVKADVKGITHSVSEDGTEVTLGSIVENGVVRRGVVGAEENSTIKKVVVGEGITTLYDRTFRRFYALETVELPAGLTAIGVEGSGVFQSCTNLKNVVIPETVTILGKGTFQECASLESINIPAGVTRIEENCLRATGLVKVEFHAGVTYFGAQAFRDCKQLKEVIINAPQFTVEANAFGVMAGTLPGTTIYVANAEMKAYLESTLTYANQFKIVVPSTVSTAEELTEALTNGETRVHLAAGTYTMPAGNKFTAETVLSCEEGVVFEGTSGLNINGATIVGATFKNEGGIAVSGTIYGTLKNCTFEGGEALRWCYSEAGKTVVFENCVINNNFRGFHFDGMKGDVLFKNCHINGFNAYGGEGTATFEGCTFGTDTRSSYNGLNIYANTVLTDCTFVFKSDKTNFIDMEDVGKTLTITNCTATLDGATADVADYVGGSKKPECTVTIDGEPISLAGWTTVNGYSKLWVNADKSEYTVFSAEGLIQMHDYWAVNAYSNHMWGKTYSISADIDATGHTWNSVFVIVGNNANNGFVIDGKGHTISNLAINGSLFTGTPNGSYAGTTPGVVRNLTFDNATVANGGYGAAVIWGNTYGEVTFEDVHIVNSSVTGVCNVAAFVGATTIEDGGTINPVKFINCSVEKCTITAIGGDGCDPTGASGYVGRAFAKTSIVFEGTNTIDAATVLNNADGLASGRVYGYTTWANGGFSGTGVCDEFVNWNGVN